MITLHVFGPAFGLPDPSPFVTKAELLLKWAQLPYQTSRKGFFKAPKGKLPYIEDDGVIVADTTFIRWHLETKYALDFDAGYSETQRGIAWAVEKLLEDHLYWAMLHYRWCDEENFRKGSARFFRRLPWPLRPLMERRVRHQMRRSLHAHGMGRHSEADMVKLAQQALASVAAILGAHPYLLGERRCAADATLSAFMAGVLCPHFDTPIRNAALGHANLVAYHARMMQEYYPDLAPAGDKPAGMAA